jgi:hypothetical protein
LSFRNLPTTKKLPENIDADVLRYAGVFRVKKMNIVQEILTVRGCSDLTEAAFFDTSDSSNFGLPSGLPGLKGPVRSRLIDDGASMGNDSFGSYGQRMRSSPQKIDRSDLRKDDRWGSAKSSEGGSWKGKLTSPSFSGKNSNRSRWVKMEEEDSWRKSSDDAVREPRYSWNDKNIQAAQAHDTDDTTPEWATINPNQKIQITADVIEAERQKMQAVWRKELEDKKKGQDSLEEIDDDEIEKWKKEQEEQDKREPVGAPSSVPSRGAPVVGIPSARPDGLPMKGQQVNLSQLFGAGASPQQPMQQMENNIASQLSHTHISNNDSIGSPPDQGRNLLAMLNSAPPQGMPPPSMGRPLGPIPPGHMGPPGPMQQPYRPMPPPGHVLPPNMMVPPGFVPNNMMPRPGIAPPPGMQGAPMPQNFPPHLVGSKPPPGAQMNPMPPQQHMLSPPSGVQAGQQINVAALFAGGGASRPPAHAMNQQPQSQHQPSLAEIVRNSSHQ